MVRRIVLINQAANYLTVGLANAFAKQFDEVSLIAGSIHEQGETLDPSVRIYRVKPWVERPAWKKAMTYGIGLAQMWFLLLTRLRRREVLFISAPPMGYCLNLVTPNRFSILIWDVFPYSFSLAGMNESHWIYRSLSRLNQWSFSKASYIFAVTDSIAALLSKYGIRENITVTPLWSIFQKNSRIKKDNNIFLKEYGGADKFIIQYSGNIGASHNVEVLLDLAEFLKHEEEYLFQIIGRGPRLEKIMTQVKQRSLPNVQFIPFQPDHLFPHSLSAASLGAVIQDERVSLGSVPSKAYNLMSFGIPSLYIAAPDSELAKYAARYRHGACFRASQIEEMAMFVKKISTDSGCYRELSQNAERAALDFRRENADRLVIKYLGISEIPSGPAT